MSSSICTLNITGTLGLLGTVIIVIENYAWMCLLNTLLLFRSLADLVNLHFIWCGNTLFYNVQLQHVQFLKVFQICNCVKQTHRKIRGLWYLSTRKSSPWIWWLRWLVFMPQCTTWINHALQICPFFSVHLLCRWWLRPLVLTSFICHFLIFMKLINGLFENGDFNIIYR